MGFIGAAVLVAIIMLFFTIRDRIELNKCLVSETTENVVTFTYKGQLYDRNKYIELRVNKLLIKSDIKRLEKLYDEAYKSWERRPNNVFHELEVTALTEAMKR